MTITANQNFAAAAIGEKVDPRLGPKGPTQDADRVERWVYRIVLFVMAAVPSLAFLFSFGNVGDLGVNLGVDKRIAYLTGPGVDLFVTGLNVAATWLSHKGRTEKQLRPVHALSAFCGLIMFALNCGPAFYARHFELAGFNAVGPFLLIAMGLVGPWLLRQLADARQAAPAAAAEGGSPAVEAAEAATVAPATEAAMPPAPATGNQAAMTAAAKRGGNGKPRQKKTAAAGAAAPNWGDLALPLWQEYVRQHNGEAPTAPVLVGRLRAAYPNLKVPGSERSERNIRKDTEALAAARAASAVASGRDGADA